MANKRICSVEGCDNHSLSRGFCNKHYLRWKKHGDPAVVNHIKVNDHDASVAFLIEAISYQADDCLIWPFGLTEKGYPRITFEGRSRRAHRTLCEKAHGLPSDPSLDASHSCGNRRCMNPRHLRWATRKENHADKLLHGTHNRGSQSCFAKLTEGDVRHIRGSRGIVSEEKLAAKYGVTRSTIACVMQGRTWKWLK